MSAHGLQFSGTGDATAPFAPQTVADKQQVIRVVGLTAKNTGTGAATVIVYDGSATGPILAIVAVPALANAAPGAGDINFAKPRTSLNGLHFEVDGTSAVVAATCWVD